MAGFQLRLSTTVSSVSWQGSRYVYCLHISIGIVHFSYVLTLPSVGDYEHHTATSGLHASGSGSAWGSNQEARSHAVEDLSNWCNIFRSEEHTSELQSHYSISYAVFCLKK